MPTRPKVEKGPAKYIDSAGGADPDLVNMIERDILDAKPNVRWEDIAGLDENNKPFLSGMDLCE